MSYVCVCGCGDGVCPCCEPEDDDDDEEPLEEVEQELPDGAAGFIGEPHPTKHKRSTRRTEYFIYSLR